jgi:hypothetical protein
LPREPKRFRNQPCLQLAQMRNTGPLARDRPHRRLREMRLDDRLASCYIALFASPKLFSPCSTCYTKANPPEWSSCGRTLLSEFASKSWRFSSPKLARFVMVRFIHDGNTSNAVIDARRANPLGRETHRQNSPRLHRLQQHVRSFHGQLRSQALSRLP